ncbi:MAG: hypothetical protein LCH73_02980 [Proteobacteria bacterium]|nr:hypothetical protein [Pseudomonadota bacterium]
MSVFGAPFGFFALRSGLLVPLPGGTAFSAAVYPQVAVASWEFRPDGSAWALGDFDWKAAWYLNGPANVGAAHDIRVTKLWGITPTGNPLGTWLSLIYGRSWSLSMGGQQGSKSCALLVEIGLAGSGVVAASGQYEIEASLDY